MTPSERAALLSQWIAPSSNTEVEQQERAERMVRAAIANHADFAGITPRVYAKGSYANNTNVRQDSDVDLVVEFTGCHWADVQGEPVVTYTNAYAGPWTKDVWRQHVTRAMTDYFQSGVDASGQVAIAVAAVSGSRPSIDVVPAFAFVRYLDAARSRSVAGSCIWTKDGSKIVNWPDQQLVNGRAKNDRTGKRYKRYVRVLKRAENWLCEQGSIKSLPSYLMECLVYNVPDAVLKAGDLDAGFRATLVWLWGSLGERYDRKNWVEPNGLQYLFHDGQKWTRDARTLVSLTWGLMGY